MCGGLGGGGATCVVFVCVRARVPTPALWSVRGGCRPGRVLGDGAPRERKLSSELCVCVCVVRALGEERERQEKERKQALAKERDRQQQVLLPTCV